jgi:hypothetical protein
MTLPDERYRAVLYAKKFMEELIYDRKTYPRLPKIVRQRAASVLKHYPSEYDLKIAAHAAPNIFAERMEPVTRLMAQYEESKKDNA